MCGYVQACVHIQYEHLRVWAKVCVLNMHVHLYVQVCMPVTNEVHCLTSNCLLHLVFKNLHLWPGSYPNSCRINDKETLCGYMYLRIKTPQIQHYLNVKKEPIPSDINTSINIYLVYDQYNIDSHANKGLKLSVFSGQFSRHDRGMFDRLTSWPAQPWPRLHQYAIE